MVVKSFQNDVWSTTLGIKRGSAILPFNILNIATPAVIATNTIANATDKAEVYRKESETEKNKK